MSGRKLVVALLFVSVLLVPAFASAASQNYAYTIPATGDVYTTSYSLSGGYDFGVRHRYSGGKNIVMQVVRANDYIALGSSKIVSPGGSSAPLTNLWYNSGLTRSVRVRMNSAFGVVVTVLAEGTWYWNY